MDELITISANDRNECGAKLSHIDATTSDASIAPFHGQVSCGEAQIDLQGLVDVAELSPRGGAEACDTLCFHMFHLCISDMQGALMTNRCVRVHPSRSDIPLRELPLSSRER